MKNYYDILGIKMGDSQLQIKKAYFSLVRKYPPDRFADEFMEIREAYEVLSNEETRREYDEVIVLSPAIRTTFEYSRHAFVEGDYNTAIKGLEEISLRVPKASLVQDLLGQAYLENGNSGKAVGVFKKLVLQYPSNAAFMGHLADAYLTRGWHRKARSAFERAIQLDEDNVSFWLGWSMTCAMADDFRAQKAVLTQALEKSRQKHWDNIELYLHIIQNDILMDNLEDVEAHLDELVKLAVEREDIRQAAGWALSTLANDLLKAGWVSLANTMINGAVQLFPDNEEIQNIKNKLERLGNLELQIEQLMNDEDIHDDIKYLMGVELIPKSMAEDFASADIMHYMLEYTIADEINVYLSSIHKLKEKYPELYSIKQDYFQHVVNPKKRRKLLRKLRSQYRKYAAMVAALEDDWDGGEDDWYADGGWDADEDWDWDDDEDGIWFDDSPQQPYVREHPKIGRNDPCPCGSGKKYKKCCGRNI